MNITVVDLYGNQDSIHKSQKSPKKSNKSSAIDQDDAASIDSVNKLFNNKNRKGPIRSFLSKLSNRIVFAFHIIFTSNLESQNNNNNNNKNYKNITEVRLNFMRLIPDPYMLLFVKSLWLNKSFEMFICFKLSNSYFQLSNFKRITYFAFIYSFFI